MFSQFVSLQLNGSNDSSVRCKVMMALSDLTLFHQSVDGILSFPKRNFEFDNLGFELLHFPRNVSLVFLYKLKSLSQMVKDVKQMHGALSNARGRMQG